MVEKLHANKGETIGGYYRLSAPDTHQIYELMLDPSQVKSAEKVAEPVEA